MTEFFNVLRLEEAQRLIKDKWPRTRTEELPLNQALGRKLAVDITARENLPPFERSTVDGYAVRSQDVFGASESIPAFLALKGEVQMGTAAGVAIGPNECAWVPTGGAIPAGADAMVMVEYTEKLGDDTVLITRPAGPGDSIIKAGEDCSQGDVGLAAGTVLRPQDIGVAAALGYSQLQVECAVRVGIISTGDEIVDVNETPGAGQVRDVNRYALAAAVTRRGGTPTLYGIIPDDFDRLVDAIKTAFNENDIVLLSGGSSVGTRDMSLQAMLSLAGAELLFHGLSVKPGKPTLAAAIGEKLAVGLPGHPVSALMMFETTVGQVLSPGLAGTVGAVLSDSIASQPGRDDFVRVALRNIDDMLYAVPVHGKAGLIRVMSRADGFIHIPYEKQGFNKGEQVSVHLF
ncbi:MAG: gephyrin-like molybdotransferase Glp [Candidatus Saccharibacteria bacterium]